MNTIVKQLETALEMVKNSERVTATEVRKAQEEMLREVHMKMTDAIDKVFAEMYNKLQPKVEPLLTHKVRPTAARPEVLKFLHAGAKVVIGSQINQDKFLELRQAGFCEGMKFNVVRCVGTDRWLVYSPRHKKQAVISGRLLNSAE